MPELPEVQVVVNGLRKKLTHKKFKAIEIKRNLTNFNSEIFEKRIKGQAVMSIERIGKMIVIHLEKELLVVHLKMTGQIIYHDQFLGGHTLGLNQKEIITPFTRIIFILNDDKKLVFNDQRTFGYIHLIEKKDLINYSKKYGLDPINSKFTWKDFWKVIQKHLKASFKPFLLNQKYIAGIGNIYADEIAFQTKIHPQRKLGSISKKKWKEIHQAIREILLKSIQWNGTTFSHFLESSGEKGNFKQFLKAYGKSGEPCIRCKTTLKKIKVAGRGTVFCPKCQKSTNK